MKNPKRERERKERRECVIALTLEGMAAKKIADVMGISWLTVRHIQSNCQKSGQLPPDTPEKIKACQVEGKLARKVRRMKAQARARALDADGPNENPAYACLAHWRDLDRHHPTGWASYKEKPCNPRHVATYAINHHSGVGSPAAACMNG